MKNLIWLYSNLGDIFQCGDFNSKVSRGDGFMQMDDSDYIPVGNYYNPDIQNIKRKYQDIYQDTREKNLLICVFQLG